jgi:hypothetical protein
MGAPPVRNSKSEKALAEIAIIAGIQMRAENTALFRTNYRKVRLAETCGNLRKFAIGFRAGAE